LKHSLPDAPPIATIAGNIAIHGSGHLSQSEGGFHSEMVTGLEVVLPTGEIVRLGSCSTVPGWFSRAPLPDLAGLFLGWNGTTGIITKVGLKLYPRPLLADALVFMSDDVAIVPDVIHRVTGTELAEDVAVMIAPKPDMFNGLQLTLINITANSKKEMEFKTGILHGILKDYCDSREAGFAPLPPQMKGKLLEQPAKNLTAFADVAKGGGFEYVGGIMPCEKLPEAVAAGLSIAEKNGVTYSLGARVIGRGHCIMFFFAYPFNRANQDSMRRAAQSLEDANKAMLVIGGIPWKAEAPAQALILKQMDPNTYEFIRKIKKALDPNGIMNPGNWEVT
jgi:glycolate oxidase